MKLTIVLLISAILQVNAASYGQKITLIEKSASLEKIFKEIRIQSGYDFFYNSKLIKKANAVDISVKDASLEETLEACFANQPLSYTIQMKTVVVKEKLIKSTSPIDITGKVTDEKGVPLPGASVKVKGTSMVASTNANGEFTIKGVENDAILIVTYIGFIVQEVKVNSRSVINITLKEESTGLREVVIVGYGTQKKVNLSGSVAVIGKDDLVNKPVPNLMQALQGVSPGVTITRGSGQPGVEGTAIRIRGFSSANPVNALVLVDGIEMDMSLINPEDVETISVLKDASAAAIYGAKAAGGVVLVTTKKGFGSKPKITYTAYYGVNKTARQPERLSPWDEQTLIDEARFNALGTREFTAEQVEWVKNANMQYRENPTADRWDYYSSNDWVKEGLDTYNGMKQHSVSIGGGSSKLNYLASGSYYNRDGILRYGPDDHSRTSFRVNVNSELNKYVNIGFIGGYIGNVINQNSRSTGEIIDRLYRSRNRQPLLLPVEDETGLIYNGDLQANAIDMQKNGGLYAQDNDTFQGKFSLNVKNLVKGLSLDVIAWRNQDVYASSRTNRTLMYYGRSTATQRTPLNVPNSYEVGKYKQYQDNFQSFATYNLQLATKHNFKVMGGIQLEDFRKDEFSTRVNSLVNNDAFALNFGDPLTKTNTDNIESWAFLSYFGRFNYDFSEKYLFEATIRYDGSSRLAPTNRWELFPAFSGAWRISEENFVKENLPVVSNLKLRGSWGKQGNAAGRVTGSNLGFYDFIPQLNTGNALVFNGVRNSYYFQGVLASPDKTWETITQSNIGLDVGLLKEKLTFTADIFQKVNRNMLAPINVSSILGINTPEVNEGKLKSWGWELETKWRSKIDRVNYSVGFNISDNQNKLIEYNGQRSIGTGGVISKLEGYPLNSLWGYKTDGYFQTQEEADAYRQNVRYPFFTNTKPGDVKYIESGEPDGVISPGGGTPENPGDLIYLGSINARYTFGADLGLNWKGIDFSVFFQGAAKRKFLIQTNTIQAMAGAGDMAWSIHMDRWTPDNPNAFFPRMYEGELSTTANPVIPHNFQPSDRYAQNGNYIRLKNLTLGYTIPLNKKYIQNLRVYFSGQDLWEKTKVLSVFDPEVGNDASAREYPFYRTASFGINVTL